jgi:mRNA interferase RelE/StbE
MDQLAQVAPRIVSAVVELVYGDLAHTPERVGKPLRFDLTGRHSARRGEYRIVYRIDHDRDVVAIEAVAPRSTIYRWAVSGRRRRGRAT